MLKNRFVPEANTHRCNRSCKTAYLSVPWSVVVKIILSTVSIVCYLSPKTFIPNILGAFVNRRYLEWPNIMDKDKKHSRNSYLQEAVTLALATIDRFKKRGVG